MDHWRLTTRCVRFLSLDVTSEDSVRNAMDTVASKHSRLDVLVNAVGLRSKKPLRTQAWNSGTAFSRERDGHLLVSKHALPLLRQSTASGGASVVNFGSYDGFIADPLAVTARRRALSMPRPGQWRDHGPEGIG